MPRLIDADTLKAVYKNYLNEPHVRVMTAAGQGMQIAIKSCIELLDNETTIDAVPVVRCKDCKFCCLDLSGREKHLCTRKEVGFFVKRKLDDFCSYGEREENESRI